MANASIKNLFSLLQNRCLKTSATLSPPSPLPKPTKASTFTVQFLVNSCGLPLESALSAATSCQLHEKRQKKHQSVVDFFKSHGFSQTQITKLIEKRPLLLRCKVENNLKPRFDYLAENGFVGELLPELVLKDPGILRRSVNSHIKPSFEILRSYLDSNEKIILAVKRSSWLLSLISKSFIQRNADFLINEGVPADAVAKLIMSQPRAILQTHDRMVCAVKFVKNLGLEPKSPNFVLAVRVMLSMSASTWKKKMEVMKSLGWSEEDIWSTFKNYPLCLACSEDKLRSVMNFFVHTMKLEPQTIISYPKFLLYCLEKRLLPRYRVLNILQSKKLIKERRKILWLLTSSNKVFLNKYVTNYMDQVPGLLEIYNGTNKAMKIET